MILYGVLAVVLVTLILHLRYQKRQARKERRGLADAKTQFMQNASHEMRTPLALIVAYAAMLVDSDPDGFSLGPLNEEQMKAAGVLHRRAQALHTIVDDMLMIMELTENNSELVLQVEEFNLFDMLAPVLEDFRVLCREKGLEFVVIISRDITLVGDAKYVLRAIENIVRNAIKFTDEGNVTVQATVEDGDVLVRIVDTGIGIPGDQISAIFNRFCQVNGSTTRRYGGSGLGLSVADEVLRAHGGYIKVVSKVGVGSIFCLHFPVDSKPATQ